MVSSGSDSRPLIGISCYLEQTRFGVWDIPAAVLPRGYVAGVVAAGGAPVLLPPVGPWHSAEVSRLDGLILAGGPDLDPAGYGERPHPRTGRPRPERDAAERALLTAALERSVPVLGVCRGMQLLNVVLGGTLRQHLPDLVGDDHQPRPGLFGQVSVTVAEHSRLAGLLGGRLLVSCHHHQAVDRLGTGLTPVAVAEDGTVEAVERADNGFVLGVQWHPEEQTTDFRLFEGLVLAARQRLEART